MSDIAIKIEGLGKRYRYGGTAPLSANLRSDLTEWGRRIFSTRQRQKLNHGDTETTETGRSGIICTYNRAESLRRTLQTCCDLVIPEGVTWELLVVDKTEVVR